MHRQEVFGEFRVAMGLSVFALALLYLKSAFGTGDEFLAPPRMSMRRMGCRLQYLAEPRFNLLSLAQNRPPHASNSDRLYVRLDDDILAHLPPGRLLVRITVSMSGWTMTY